MSEFDKELGFLGNVDEELTMQYVETELIKKAEQGDKTSLFKLHQIARHSKQEDIRDFVRSQMERLDGTQTYKAKEEEA